MLLPLLEALPFRCVLFAGIAMTASASPLNSKLLPLVPEGAQIVAGVEDPHKQDSRGRLIFVTHRMDVDYGDWIALTGVDSHRVADEVIEAGCSASKASPEEHLLLVAGRFDRDRIYRSAEQNGASVSKRGGEDVLIVEPFAREKGEMPDTRWMSILGNSIVVFGTPRMVQAALDRYEKNAAPDAALTAKLSQLRGDVNSWSVLAMPGPILATRLERHLLARWPHFFDNVDELTLGIHYGSSIRIDFAMHEPCNPCASWIQNLPAQPHTEQVALAAGLQVRIQKLSMEQGRIRGSIRIAGNQFESWMTDVESRALHGRELASKVH